MTRPPTAIPAPAFVLPDLEGRPVGLADFRGRILFLNFWATWCPPCPEELPALAELARDVGEPGLAVLTVNHEGSPGTVRTFLREIGLGIPVLLDRDGAVADRYGVVGLPTTVLVDRDGRLVGRAVGYRDWRSPAARAYLAELLARPRASAGGLAPGRAGRFRRRPRSPEGSPVWRCGRAGRRESQMRQQRAPNGLVTGPKGP